MEKLLTVAEQQEQEKPDPKIYGFDGVNVRTVKIDNVIYIIAKDVCNILDFHDVEYVLEQLDIKDKMVAKNHTFVNQSAVYQIIEMSASSDKAEYFKKWLDDEVFHSAELSLVVDNTNDVKVKLEDEVESEIDNNFKLFEHEDFGKVRTVFENEEVWFVAKDVADILEFSETNAMTRSLDKDEVMSVSLSGMNMKSNLISESGLYQAIFKSRKPQARKFRKWVTSEVLPTIRKTGGYVSNADMMIDTYFGSLPDNQKTLITGLFNNIEEQQKAIIEKDKRIAIDKPKVETYDRFMNGENYFDMKKVAKLIGWGRNKLFEQLRNDDILMTGNNHNEPRQSFVDREYFKVVAKPVANGTNKTVTLVTAKGADWLARKYG